MNENNQEGLAQALFSKGILFDLDIGRWYGVKQMQPGDLLLEGQIDDGTLYMGHKKLLPKSSLALIAVLEGRARAALAARSVDFPIAGARFVTYRAMGDVRDVLSRIKQEWQEAVNALVLEYPRLRDEQLAALDRQAHKLADEHMKKWEDKPEWQRRERQEIINTWLEAQKKENRIAYPEAEKIGERFRFTWRTFSIAPQDYVQELNAEEVIQAQNQLRQDLQHWVRDASMAMHQSLGEAASKARAMLEKSGKLNARSLRPLFEAFQAFKDMNFTGSTEFSQTIDELRSRFLTTDNRGDPDYASTANELNNGNSVREFTDLLSSLSILATDTVAREAGIKAINTGEFSRFVEL